MKKLLSFFLLLIALLVFVAPAFAAPGYSLFDQATIVTGGYSSPFAVETKSDTALTPAWGGIDFVVPAGTTFADLTNLSTYYKITAGDCGGGAPRFAIALSTGKYISVYLGPGPNFTGCTLNTWVSSGEFINSSEKVYDLTQSGGPFYGTYAEALALVGTTEVTGISLVTDGGWMASGSQTILFDNVQINSDLYTFDQPTSMEQCKKDGWKNFSSFKNQGDCVSYIQSSPNAVGNKTK